MQALAPAVCSRVNPAQLSYIGTQETLLIACSADSAIRRIKLPLSEPIKLAML